MHACLHIVYVIHTSISQRLLPKNSADIFDPRLFDFRVHSFHHDRLVWLPLSEPYLESSARFAHFGCETDVRRFHAMLVNIDVQILPKAPQTHAHKEREKNNIIETCCRFHPF